MFNDKNVFISGGTGSFGTRFLRKILSDYKPRKVIIYSRDEFKQYNLAQKLCDDRIRFIIGDVRDKDRLNLAMREMDFVVHAAALKHVSIAEYNPFEFIHTNVIGAENIISAALHNRVGRVIALSTDKAANPANLYGASKLASDKIFVAANNMAGTLGTKFSVVRYGNVVGSRGSVVPYFRKLIEDGATELPITDPRMTRFLITLDQSINFVINSFSAMQGGEIFVPKIPSVKITDLARVMAPKARQKIIGIRPGEKLHEIMVTEDDARQTVEVDGAYVIVPRNPIWTNELKIPNSRPVAEDFIYSSNRNTDWIEDERLSEMLEACNDDE